MRLISLALAGAACLLGLGMASSARRLTLVVVPARYSVIQVAFDVAARYPAILVSYQGDASTEVPLLHAWNGREWVYVSLTDYSEARFLQTVPAQAVLVGGESDLPPVLVDATAWCQMVMSIPAIDTPTLINSLGKVFDFRDRDWQWFARRYNLDLMDLNAQYRGESWYDRPSVEGSPFERQMPPPAYEGDVYEAPVVEEAAGSESPPWQMPAPSPIYADPPVEEPVAETPPAETPAVEETIEVEPAAPEATAPAAEPVRRSRAVIRTSPPAGDAAAPPQTAPEGWREKAVAAP
ncbi:MAG: hypothetical protein JXB04_11850 [Kiritimatiellae bacterium]|nr:hypothetical protein [Kiritimatiellia bacterium]